MKYLEQKHKKGQQLLTTTQTLQFETVEEIVEKFTPEKLRMIINRHIRTEVGCAIRTVKASEHATKDQLKYAAKTIIRYTK